jgi:hypothetical protein
MLVSFPTTRWFPPGAASGPTFRKSRTLDGRLLWHYNDDETKQIDYTVTVEAQARNNQFKDFGDAVYGDKRYKYSMVGEVTPTWVVLLIHKAKG